MDKHTPSEREHRLVTFANALPFHEGPLQEVPEYNGIFVEDILHAAKDRLVYLNDGEFRNRETSLAITKIEEALHWLQARTERRVAAGIEGTYQTMEGEG